MTTEIRIVPISRKEDIAKAKFILDTADLSQGWVMELTTAKRKRSNQANKYYWKAVIGTLSRELWGEVNPMPMHSHLKKEILAPVMNREGVTVVNSKSRDLANDWLIDWDSGKGDEDARQRLYRRLSTTWLSNKGMSLYIELCKEWAAEMNIVISEPEDMK